MKTMKMIEVVYHCENENTANKTSQSVTVLAAPNTISPTVITLYDIRSINCKMGMCIKLIIY